MFKKARNIQSTIRSVLGASANDLVRVSEIQNETVEDAIHKIQIQIFELSDALAELVRDLDNRV
ncbi:MAG: hypothetical protein QM621_14665 [Aeromicrobium sp.]|uniref:hypothetical protein n=1 Tax=Aeromicrobium sp. TaxID=1871063 RepID=UPI0039E5829D